MIHNISNLAVGDTISFRVIHFDGWPEFLVGTIEDITHIGAMKIKGNSGSIYYRSANKKYIEKVSIATLPSEFD